MDSPLPGGVSRGVTVSRCIHNRHILEIQGSGPALVLHPDDPASEGTLNEGTVKKIVVFEAEANPIEYPLPVECKLHPVSPPRDIFHGER